MCRDVKLEYAISEVRDGVMAAARKHRPYASAHEAYAVILEELEEFWSEVIKKKEDRNSEVLLGELRDIASASVKAIVDLGLIDDVIPM